MADTTPAASIERTGEHGLRITGALTFATAARVWSEGERELARLGGDRVEIDCSGLSAADSAGLAVLVQWLATGRRQGRSVTLRGLPRAVVDIARISEVEELIQPGG
jgi:phospholipid transport system transporter-binding protein